MTWTEAVVEAARAHRPVPQGGVAHACYLGDCDHDDECPEMTFTVCRECMRIAQEINDEIIPDEVMADRCIVCVAVSALGPTE